jgi:hypothetical protein
MGSVFCIYAAHRALQKFATAPTLDTVQVRHSVNSLPGSRTHERAASHCWALPTRYARSLLLRRRPGKHSDQSTSHPEGTAPSKVDPISYLALAVFFRTISEGRNENSEPSWIAYLVIMDSATIRSVEWIMDVQFIL